jgi:hypothetical protein
MRRSSLFSTLFLLIVAMIFVSGVIELLILRFQKGDAYPPYSSYRFDPLGTEAFYEGLSLLPGVDTARNTEPLNRVAGLSGAAIFLFGLERSDFSSMPKTSVQALEDAARGGARIVISFAPTDARPAAASNMKEKPPENDAKQNETPQKDVNSPKDERESYGKTYVNLAGQWSVETQLSAEHNADARLSAAEKGLPASLAWHTTLVFKPQENVWRTIYAREGKPVLMERTYGKGSIVLSSDSFFLSNEAMKNSRYPHLLSWLCGNHRKIVFDETHLGISKSTGIATLLRRHGLAPFFASLILLALLAIWRQSTSFVPVYEEDEKTFVDESKDCSTGLTNLLRRNIPADGLLTVCLEEWKRSFTYGKQNLSGLLPRIQEIIAADHAQPRKRRNPVQAYRKISALLDSHGRGRGRRGADPHNTYLHSSGRPSLRPGTPGAQAMTSEGVPGGTS